LPPNYSLSGGRDAYAYDVSAAYKKAIDLLSLLRKKGQEEMIFLGYLPAFTLLKVLLYP
jgi:hypothetical protein